MPDKGNQLDLSSDAAQPSGKAADSNGGGKRFLGVHFVCCDIYSRIYLNRDQSAYIGHCPRCAKRVQFTVGAGGTESRFFKVQ